MYRIWRIILQKGVFAPANSWKKPACYHSSREHLNWPPLMLQWSFRLPEFIEFIGYMGKFNCSQKQRIDCWTINWERHMAYPCRWVPRAVPGILEYQDPWCCPQPEHATHLQRFQPTHRSRTCVSERENNRELSDSNQLIKPPSLAKKRTCDPQNNLMRHYGTEYIFCYCYCGTTKDWL